MSVVVAVRGHDGDPGRALASVAEQSHPELELIVVGDGSSGDIVQDTERALASVPARFRRVDVRRDATARGTSFALSRGLALAHGSYVSFLTGADRYAPARIARLVAAIREHDDRGVAFSAVVPIDDDGARTFDEPSAHVLAWQATALQAFEPSVSWALLGGDLVVPAGNVLLSRDLALTIGDPAPMEQGLGRDYLLRAAFFAEPVFVAEPLYHHRLEPWPAVTTGLAEDEARRTIAGHLRRVMTSRPPNRFAPAPHHWPTLFEPLLRELGHGDLFDAMYQPYRARHRTVEPTAIPTLAPTGTSTSVVTRTGHATDLRQRLLRQPDGATG